MQAERANQVVLSRALGKGTQNGLIAYSVLFSASAVVEHTCNGRMNKVIKSA